MPLLAPLPPRAPDARPRLEHRGRLGEQLVLVDAVGMEWVIRDVRPGESLAEVRQQLRQAPRAGAQWRLFRFRDGTVRCYTFGRHERRDVDVFHPERVEHQLQRARLLRIGRAHFRPLAP